MNQTESAPGLITHYPGSIFIDDLKAWIAPLAEAWSTGSLITPAEVDEGHTLVQAACIDFESTEAMNACYILYIDYYRGIRDHFSESPERTNTLKAIKTVF